MLFSKDNCCKFRLVGLERAVHIEIAMLIINNGGSLLCNMGDDICEFTDDAGWELMRPIGWDCGSRSLFHINYIRKCIQEKKILDLSNFRFGNRGFQECLTHSLIHEKNTSRRIDPRTPSCSTTPDTVFDPEAKGRTTDKRIPLIQISDSIDPRTPFCSTTPDTVFDPEAKRRKTDKRIPLIQISDSDSSDSDIATKKTAGPSTSKVVRRKKFRRPEEEKMVKYLIDTQRIAEAKGFEVWGQMMQDGQLTYRTPHSLHTHFRKFILPKIDQFVTDEEILKKFKEL